MEHIDLDHFTRLKDLVGRIETRIANLERASVTSAGGLPLGRLVISPRSTAASALAGMADLTDAPVFTQLPSRLNVDDDKPILRVEALPEMQNPSEPSSDAMGSAPKASAV